MSNRGGVGKSRRGRGRGTRRGRGRRRKDYNERDEKEEAAENENSAEEVDVKKDNRRDKKPRGRQNNRNRASKFRPIQSKGRRRGRGGALTCYSLNDRVMALWPDENKFYKATISSISWDGTYGVVYDTENDREYINRTEEELQPIRRQEYQVDDEVKALFVKSDRWYNAKILAEEGRGQYSIKFEHLKNNFTQKAEFLRPCHPQGTRVLALWFQDNKYLPATIVEAEEPEEEEEVDENAGTRNAADGNYTIKFDNRDQIFGGQRPDHVLEIDEFEQDEEVYALWGQDGLYYPAKVVEVVDEDDTPDKYMIQFHGLDKSFAARGFNLKKRYVL